MITLLTIIEPSRIVQFGLRIQLSPIITLASIQTPATTEQFFPILLVGSITADG